MSWEQLKDIYHKNVTNRQDELNKKPVECPIDGAPLNENAQGVLDCPMGNWTSANGGIG